MSKLLLTICVFGLLLSSASAQEVSKQEDVLRKYDLTRYVPSGKSRTIRLIYGASPDCSPWSDIEVRTTKAPEHGTVEIVAGQDFPRFAKDNVRFKCNEKKIPVLNVNYKSSEGYTGPDEFELLILYPRGLADEAHYTMVVR
jgi:hypothetical protein